jgi:hypothetical protein
MARPSPHRPNLAESPRDRENSRRCPSPRGQDTLNRYALHAYVIMANHAHILISPKVDPPKIMHSLKGFTAHEANRILGRTGSFWQRESYDHYVRDRKEFDKIVAYIENNPVKAGVVSAPEQFMWSSAHAKEEAAHA